MASGYITASADKVIVHSQCSRCKMYRVRVECDKQDIFYNPSFIVISEGAVPISDCGRTSCVQAGGRYQSEGMTLAAA